MNPRDFKDQLLSEDKFLELWCSRVDPVFGDDYDFAMAWECLQGIASENRREVSVSKIRAALLKKDSMPIEISMSESTSKTVLGTIHASKGREAKQVYLILPKKAGTGANVLEEAKVIFVGATRAKESLIVKPRGAFNSAVHGILRTRNGRRLYCKPGSGWAMLETGRDDICRHALICNSLFRQPSEAKKNQHNLLLMAKYGPIVFHAEKTNDLSYRVQVDGKTVASFANTAYGINKPIAELMGYHTYVRISGYILGASTIALSPEEMERNDVYSSQFPSGIILSPIISSMVMLNKVK